MQIVKNTGNELVIRHVPTSRRLIFLVALIACSGGILSSIDNPLYEHPTEMIILLLPILALILIPLLSSANATWTFDRSIQTFSAKNRSLLWYQSVRHSLTEISQVEVAETTDGEGAKIFTIRLKLSDGNFLYLCRDYSLSEVNAKDGAWHIAKFLGIKYQFMDNNSKC
jgi:hypothetical protein